MAVTQKRAPTFSSKATPEKQLAEMRDALNQVYSDLLPLIAEVNSHNQQLNADVSLKQILNLIWQVKGHTSVMPDNQGTNGDHDARYYTKTQIDAKLA